MRALTHIALLVLLVHSLSLPSFAVASDTSTTSITILNPEQHPPRGTLWTVHFTVIGTDNLSILPDDDNTQSDVSFESLTCDDHQRTPLELRPNILYVRRFRCSGTATVSFRILEEGTHTLKFQFGKQTVYAHNATGDFQFAKRLGGIGDDYGNGITTDSNGNIIVVGQVTGDADMNGDGDTTDGGAESSTGYGAYDAFISVFNASGTWQWAKRLGSTSDDNSNVAATDSNNNIILTGYVSGTADINGDGDSSDGGAESGTGYGNSDAFISVFDSSGTWQWAKRLGGTSYDYGYGVVIDTQNNIIVGGQINQGDADMNGDGDSTDGGAENTFGASTSVFFSVFNASGTWQFAKRLKLTAASLASMIVTDGNDNIILTGIAVGNADMNGDGDTTDGGAESSTGYGIIDGFFTVFNSLGTWQFAKRIGGPGLISFVNGVTTDSSNHIIVSGYTGGNADMNGDGDTTDGGAESATGYGSDDGFFTVFNSSGTWQFAKRLGGTSYDDAFAISTDSTDNIIVGGYVTGDADMNGDGDATDGGSESATGYGLTDSYISIFNSSGTWQFAKRLGGTLADSIVAVAADSSNIYAAGYMTGNADMNGDGDSSDGGAESATGYGSADLYFTIFSTIIVASASSSSSTESSSASGAPARGGGGGHGTRGRGGTTVPIVDPVTREVVINEYGKKVIARSHASRSSSSQASASSRPARTPAAVHAAASSSSVSSEEPLLPPSHGSTTALFTVSPRLRAMLSADASDDERFLAQLYLDLLHRPIDPVGRSMYLDALSRNFSRGWVVLNLLESPEYRSSFITELYNAIFHRAPTAEEQQSANIALRNGTTRESLTADLLGRASVSVDALFIATLGRTPDSTERAMAQQRLKAIGARTFAFRLLKSIEGRSLRIQNFYHRFLERDADSSALTTYVSTLPALWIDDLVIVSILKSEEYMRVLRQ